jgi:hypothetical protein
MIKPLFTAKCCIHYFDNNVLQVIFSKAVLTCTNIVQPKIKKTKTQPVPIKTQLTTRNLEHPLCLQAIYNEITKYLSPIETLSLLSLNTIFRTPIANKFRLVLTPKELQLACKSHLIVSIKKISSFQDSDNLAQCTTLNNNTLLCRLQTLHFNYVRYDNVQAIQTLINLIPTLPFLTSVSFLGIWKPITFPAIKLISLSLGQIWSPINFTSPIELSTLLFDKVTEQPETKKMLEELQSSIKSNSSTNNTSSN